MAFAAMYHKESNLEICSTDLPKHIEATIDVVVPATGMTYDAYTNPINAEIDATNFATDFAINPDFFRDDTLSKISCGIAQDINFGTGGPLPGQSWYEVNTSLIAVVYHGHFIVPVTGNYTWISQASTFGYIWTGDVAYNTWSVTNFVANQASQSTPQYYTAGELIPTTILYANTGGNSTCAFALGFPDGTTKYTFSGYFARPFANDTFSPMASGSCPDAPEYDPYTIDVSCSVSDYSIYHVGSGFTQYAAAHTLPQAAPISSTFTGNVSACDAALRCQQAASDNRLRGSFDLHYLRSSSEWECVTHQESNTDPRAFNVSNTDVVVGYGFYMRD